MALCTRPDCKRCRDYEKEHEVNYMENKKSIWEYVMSEEKQTEICEWHKFMVKRGMTLQVHA